MNYIEIPIEHLPSAGLFYPSNFKLFVKMLTVGNIKEISFDIDGSIIRGIIRDSVKLENCSFDELTIDDYDFICFWLRANSFVKNNGYTFNVKKCGGCGNPFEENISLDRFDIEQLEYNPERAVTLPDSGIEIDLRVPRVKSLSIVDEDPDIQKIMRWTNLSKNQVMSLSAFDFSALLNTLNDIKVGIQPYITIMCPKCGKVNKAYIDLNSIKTFGSVKITEILEMILRVCKYTNYKIEDDERWAEVEIMQDVVNKIAKEEEDAMKKQESKMKAKTASFKSSSVRNYSKKH